MFPLQSCHSLLIALLLVNIVLCPALQLPQRSSFHLSMLLQGCIILESPIRNHLGLQSSVNLDTFLVRQLDRFVICFSVLCLGHLALNA